MRLHDLSNVSRLRDPTVRSLRRSAKGVALTVVNTEKGFPVEPSGRLREN
jgi:hypothetical protein